MKSMRSGFRASPDSPLVRRVLGAAAIAAAVLFVYWPSLRGGWIWDDLSEITLNSTLRSPGGLRRIWFAPPGPDYLPLKSTLQWLEWRLFGDNPFGYHWVSLGLHFTSALLVWRLLARLGLCLAWLGALLFAVHPLAVQSVAWVSEQKNTLSLPLLLLAMGAYADTDASRGRGAYARSFFWFLAAMLAKTSVVMFPVVILLHAAWKRGRLGRANLLASVPFFAVSAALGATTVWFQFHEAIGSERLEIGGMSSRIACAGLAAAFYCGKCLVPCGLMPIYPKWPVNPPSLLQFLPWAGAAAAFAWAWARRTTWGRHVLFGMGFFVVNLLPVVGFIPMSFSRMSWVSDHLAYVALLGPVALVAAGAGAARQALANRWQIWACVGAGALLAALMLEGRAYAAVFQSGASLWSYAAAKNPGSAAAHYNLANARVLDGRLPEAVPEYEAAIRLRPSFGQAKSNFGDVLQRLGRAQEAIAQYEAALRDEPGLVPTRNKLGDLLLSQGRTEEAIGQYERAIDTQPGFAPAQANLAYALARAGRLEDAARRYEEAIRLDPANAESWDELGTVLASMGRTSEALQRYEKALRLRPDDPDAHYNLGIILARTGRISEAVPHFEAAVRLRPDFDAARQSLERAQRMMAEGAPP